MTTVLFIVGLLTSLGCGWAFLSNGSATGKQDAAVITGGLLGAAIMVMAILLSNGWQP